jgi:hypothetical protein
MRMAAAAGHAEVSQPEAGIHAKAAMSQRARRRWGAWQSAARMALHIIIGKSGTEVQ